MVLGAPSYRGSRDSAIVYIAESPCAISDIKHAIQQKITIEYNDIQLWYQNGSQVPDTTIFQSTIELVIGAPKAEVCALKFLFLFINFYCLLC